VEKVKGSEYFPNALYILWQTRGVWSRRVHRTDTSVIPQFQGCLFKTIKKKKRNRSPPGGGYHLLGSGECCLLWGRTPSPMVLAVYKDTYPVATSHYLQPSRVLPSWQLYGPSTASEQSAPWVITSLNQPQLVLAGGTVETWHIRQKDPQLCDVDSHLSPGLDDSLPGGLSVERLIEKRWMDKNHLVTQSFVSFPLDIQTSMFCDKSEVGAQQVILKSV
jgi:hypothetical protein